MSVARLPALIEGIETSLESGEAGRKIVDALVRERGARHRFTCGADELRLEGVSATCTTGHEGLLRGWCRAARRKIAKSAA